MQYPHKLKVTRASTSPGASEGTLDQDTGIWTPAPVPTVDDVVYDGMADVQDPGSMLRFNQQMLPMPTVSSDLVAYLQNEAKIRLIKNGDQAEVIWEDGSVETFTVVRTHYIDGALTLRGGEPT